MTWNREELIAEFVTTTSNALFGVVQERIGVTDGGFASLFWTGHPVLAATVEAIQDRAPSFAITEDLAFGAEWPPISAISDLEPASLRSAGAEYLRRLGEIVGADLADDELAEAYAGMLAKYVSSEESFKDSCRPTA